MLIVGQSSELDTHGRGALRANSRPLLLSLTSGACGPRWPVGMGVGEVLCPSLCVCVCRYRGRRDDRGEREDRSWLCVTVTCDEKRARTPGKNAELAQRQVRCLLTVSAARSLPIGRPPRRRLLAPAWPEGEGMNKRCQVMCEQGVGVGNDELVLFCSILSPQSQLATYYSPCGSGAGAGLDAKTTHGAARQATSAFFARHKAPTRFCEAEDKALPRTTTRTTHIFDRHTAMTAWFSEERAERVRQTKSPSGTGKQTLSASMHWRGSPKQGWQQDTSTSNSCSILGSERRGKEGRQCSVDERGDVEKCCSKLGRSFSSNELMCD